MSLAKLPFLFSGMTAGYVLMTPPQPSVPREKRSRDVTPYERFFSAVVHRIVQLAKITTCAPFVLEIAVILANEYPSNQLSHFLIPILVRGSLARTGQIALSPTFLLGWTLVLLNTTLRYRCYCALDRFFTYELTVRDGQRLVTHGPYSYVRHPSYTAVTLGAICIILMHVAQGSWTKECGILQTPAGRAFGMLHVGLCVFLTLSVAWRTAGEDGMLRNHFGKEWEAYAQRVPYRMIPYVY
ncbi:uncharacterized protein C8Q71DRAFT_321330 [Rhodofomes roseus]|uniref:Protein-S-isoprenylcysteine O-methyltransferase n=1 Tax=Rhodofomes roseus TaxID=34475 RepID=A0ABQ8K239_9APHY|nr:uncharacterized protein C8Q71DRAFT_321330 [Rhodofomes roseus]KAH9830763.1 hypothetical protein C8Q71DRAFT_321330 [Rhodofomes roseus]